MKIAVKLFLTILTLSFVFGVFFAEDDAWKNRASKEGAKSGYDFYKQQYAAKKDYDSAWKFARMCHFYANYYIKNNDTKKDIFTEGKNAAKDATKQNPNKPEGWYWYGVCLGSWADANGILDSLGAAEPIVKAATYSINCDADYEQSSAYMLRGRVYHLAPGVISIGDEKKAESDYKRCLNNAPDNRVCCRFYAEFLKERGRKDEALKIINQGLGIKYDNSNPIQEDDEIRLLKKLKDELSK